MYYFLYRFYDPSSQRWLNRDPLGEAAGINLYGFVGNNPLGAIDPYGEWWLDDRIHDIGVVLADAMWGDMQGKAPRDSYIAQRGQLLGPTEDVLTPTVAAGVAGTLETGKQIAEGYLMGKAIEAGLGFAGLGYKWLAPAPRALRGPRGCTVCQAAKAAKAAKTVATPHGPAVQAMTAEGRAALSQVQNGGTVYRAGELGVQNTGHAQFWSLQNPATTPGYAGQMGMPGAGKVDWIMGGRVTPGSLVITRPAPGIGANAGAQWRRSSRLAESE